MYSKPKAVIWHDPNMKSQENEFYAGLINGDLARFTTVNDTLAEIEKRGETCILISSGTNGEELFDKIYTAPTTKYRRKISKAAVFCGDTKKHKAWVEGKNFNIITSVENDPVKIVELLQKLYDEYNTESNHNPVEEKKNDYQKQHGYQYQQNKTDEKKQGYDDKKSDTYSKDYKGYQYQNKNDANQPFPKYNEKKEEKEKNPYQYAEVDYS